MKVVCIDDNFPETFGDYHPKVSDIVTVVSEERHDDKLYYELEEYPPLRNWKHEYISTAFAPLHTVGVDEVKLKIREEVSLSQVVDLYLKSNK